MSVSELDQALAQRCEDARNAIIQGVGWIGDNEEQVKQDKHSLLKECRKAAITAGRLKRAAERKMCVGIFGISQAGKSYLVSALARKEGRPLMANFDGQTVDFLDKINPEGGGESTGLVTRFTVDRPETLPPGFPIEVRLLSELDVVKILINSYANDVYHADEEDERDHNRDNILGQVTALRDKLAEQPLGQVSEEDIYDLEDYCNGRLLANPRIKALRRIGFWDQVADMAPRLQPDDRRRLFAIIWDDMAVYTGIYSRLQSALVSLGSEDTAYCSMDGLFTGAGDSLERHGNSIIAVGTLAAFDRGGAEAADPVAVRTQGGREVNLKRSELTALIAELRIVMEEQPDDFFDYTDLLDFPGARTRTPLPKTMVTEDAGNASELLLRGKVAYLFDRYNAEQELTSLLLCAGPENNEVEGIDELLFSWISATHGETPEVRTGKQTSLFTVLTKFDGVFGESAGKKNPFPTRMDTSLLEPYCKRHDWPKSWDDAGAFKGCYAVRNPKFKQDAMFVYASADKFDGDLYYTETGVRDDKQQLVQELHDLFVGCDEVVAHFKDPERAWESLMTLNDGGIGYLVESLKPVCNPDIKREQVAARLDRLREQVAGRLQSFYISGDQDAELKKKEAMVQQVMKMMTQPIGEHRFGELLEHLQASEEDVYDQHYAAKSLPVDDEDSADEGGASPRRTVAAADVLGDLSDMFGDDSADAGKQCDEPEAVSAPRDFPARFAGKVEEYWADRSRGLRDHGELMRYFGLQDELYGKMVDELVIGARRLGLFGEIAEEVRQFHQFKETTSVWKDVAAACALLNDYVSFLGLGGKRQRGGTRIERLGKVRHVFQPREPVGEYPEIPAAESDYDMTYCRDWLMGFFHLVTENVKYQAGVAGSLEENARLGRVLEVLQKAAA
jgi:hypothetical protein